MSPLAALHRWAERRFHALLYVGTSDEATHTQHALVIVLAFGTLGAFVGWLLGVPALGFRAGLVAGWTCYVVRELDQRRGRWRWRLWDGACDVAVPAAWIAAVVTGSVWALWLGAAVVALLYVPLRPRRP